MKPAHAGELFVIPYDRIMIEVTGIDHIYVAVSDLARSEAFYDRVMLEALGFRKNKFAIDGDRHVQYFSRLLQAFIARIEGAPNSNP